MVKKIRFKFVAVTMTFLTVIFDLIFLIDFFYETYLYKQDTIQLLDSIADSEGFRQDIFLSDDDDYFSEVFAVEFDENGKIKNISSSLRSDIKSDEIKNISEKLYMQRNNNGKYKSYVYAAKTNPDGSCFLAFSNLNAHGHQLKKVVGTVALVIIAFCLLLLVSIFLSRFVTEPAQKALEREKQFISDASHELKTPISAIILNAQAMYGITERNKYMDNILSEGERMNKLIKRLLILAYADESENRIEMSEFSLSESCEEISLPFESAAYENEIDFRYNISENIFYNGNCEDIKQVISILLDNAFKYTPQKGEIVLKLFTKNGRPVLTVFNTGNGISEEAMPHIFDRFYCLEKSRNKSSSSFGLGLSIAKAIMNAHNGTIKADSEYGKYALFTVLF